MLSEDRVARINREAESIGIPLILRSLHERQAILVMCHDTAVVYRNPLAAILAYLALVSGYPIVVALRPHFPIERFPRISLCRSGQTCFQLAHEVQRLMLAEAHPYDAMFTLTRQWLHIERNKAIGWHRLDLHRSDTKLLV